VKATNSDRYDEIRRTRALIEAYQTTLPDSCQRLARAYLAHTRFLWDQVLDYSDTVGDPTYKIDEVYEARIEELEAQNKNLLAAAKGALARYPELRVLKFRVEEAETDKGML
jgi:hypothetical protein